MTARYEITTDRLRIAPVDVTMVDEVYAAVKASENEIASWMAWASNMTYEDELAFIHSAERGWDSGTLWAFVFFTEERIAGGVGLTRHGLPYLERAEIGYWIATELAGRGLTTEAAAAVTHFGFEVLGLHRIELQASPGNHGSHRVAEKVGFIEEGRHRDSTRSAQGWLDTISYGLLDSDPRLIPEPISFAEQG